MPLELTPETRADLESVAAAVEAELAKPPEQQDREFLTTAVATIEAFEQQMGAEGTADQFAQQTFQGEVTETLNREIPGQGFQQQISPKEQLSTRAAELAFSNRMQDIGDFFQRPFLDDEEQAKIATQRRVERAAARLQLEADARASGVDPAELQAAEITGGIAPDVLLGGGPAAIGARTAGAGLARIGAEAGVGSVLGGSTVPLDQDPSQAAAVGGTLGFGFGLVGELPGAGVDFLRRELRAARNSDQNARLAQISEEAGIDLTLSERTQSPAAFLAEQQVPGRPGGPRDEFMQRRNQQIDAAFESTTDSLNPERLSVPQIVTKTKEAFEETISAKSQLASASFRAQLEEPIKQIGAKLDDEGRLVGGFKFIRTPELVQELRTQRQLLAEQPLSGATTTALRQLDQEIERLQTGKLDIGQVQRLLSDLSGKNAPSGIVIKDNSQAADILSTPAVQRALNRDLDAIAAGDDEFADVVGALQTARKDFAADRAEIDVFKNRSVDKLLGKVGDPAAEDFGKKILSMDKQSFSELIDLVDEADPQLGQGIRAAVFEELVDKHRVTDLARVSADDLASQIQVPKLMGEINKMPFSKFQAFISKDIPAEQARQIRNTMVALEAIAQGPAKAGVQGGRGLREKFEQYAINAASQDKGFVSRLLAGELAPGAMERLLFTPEGQFALSRLSAPRIGRAEFAQSANFVVTAMAEDEEQTAEIRRQRAAQQQQQRLQRVGDIPL